MKDKDWRTKNLPPHEVGERNYNWKGGVHYRKDGYELVRIGIISRSSKGARYKLKHRIVMEEFLRRPLLRNEIVHHINGNMSDNRIENLQLMTQSEHAKLHVKDKKPKVNGRWID